MQKLEKTIALKAQDHEVAEVDDDFVMKLKNQLADASKEELESARKKTDLLSLNSVSGMIQNEIRQRSISSKMSKDISPESQQKHIKADPENLPA